MSMDLDDLQLLLDVAELGSFSQAAAIRGWSQPLVSQRIAQLEESLGAPLFQRHRRGVTPTRACEEFLPAARSALAILSEGRLALQGGASTALYPSLQPAIPYFGGVWLAIDGAGGRAVRNPLHHGSLRRDHAVAADR